MTNVNDSKNWSFETRQLHIGQEQADPTTDARAVPIYASTSFVFHNSKHAADRFGLRDAGNIRRKTFSKKESLLLKAVLLPLPLPQEQQQLTIRYVRSHEAESIL